METKKRTGILPLALVCIGLSLAMLLVIFTGSGKDTADAQVHKQIDLGQRFSQGLSNQISTALYGEVPIYKSYTLNDLDLAAPEPNQDCYGQVATAGEMAPILQEAAPLLDGQATLFTTETELLEECPVRYYLDETIFAVTWKQVVGDCVYTFSEVKIAHPTQFRRFLSEGVYGSNVEHTTTEMSESVNAVVAASGDYYGYRSIGVVINEGHVYREDGNSLDICYIDDQGDLLFTRAKEITGKDALQKFVADNHVRFSICFGPVLIENGEYCAPTSYNVGEIHQDFARAALCQMGPLHYVVVTANYEGGHRSTPSISYFAARLHEMGIPTAYALDGGQTAAIAMNDTLINSVSYGSQRQISDIIYFATALPESDR